MTKSEASWAAIRMEAARRGIISVPPLWPARYRKDCPKSAYRYLTECCWTFNEADSKVELIPKKKYIRKIVRIWWQCRRSRRTIIFFKSRRLLVSWILCGLELWAGGLKPEKSVLVGVTYEMAYEHVWRYWHLYEELRARRKDFRHLRAALKTGGDPLKQMLEKVILPNGTLFDSMTSTGQAFQGTGFTRVRMEEPSHYKNPGYTYGQALRVTEGKAESQGGHVYLVANAFPNQGWQDLKKCAGE